MLLLCLIDTALAVPQTGLSYQQSLGLKDFSPNEGIIRGHLKVVEEHVTSDIWLEVSYLPQSSSPSAWLIQPQELTWATDKLEIGYQVHRWGQLDILSASDIISPKDLRWGPRTPVELYQQSNPSITGQIKWAKWRFQPAMHLGPASSSISVGENRWSLFPPSEESIIWTHFNEFTGEAIDQLIWASIVESLENSERSFPFGLSPQPTYEYPIDLTLRMDLTTPTRSFGSGIGWVRSRTPKVSLDPTIQDILNQQTYPSVLSITETIESIDTPITLEQPHTLLSTVWYSQLIGRFGLRLESSYQYKSPVQEDLWSSSTGNISQAAVGFDTLLFGDTAISTEHRIQHTQSESDDLWLTETINLESALTSQGSYLQQRLNWKSLILHNWSFHETLIQGEFTWKLGGQWSTTLGTLWLIGETPEDFKERISYRGGQIGYFSDNDDFYLRIGWTN